LSGEEIDNQQDDSKEPELADGGATEKWFWRKNEGNCRKQHEKKQGGCNWGETKRGGA
jgi:hypothetical protein